MNVRKGFLWGLLIALIIAVVVALVAWVFMYLWNWLIPTLFNGPIISIWQAIGLLVLSKLLFGGWGKGKSSSHWRSKGNKWQQHWTDRCANMTPEEKEQLKDRFMNKWNCEPTFSRSNQSDQTTESDATPSASAKENA